MGLLERADHAQRVDEALGLAPARIGALEAVEQLRVLALHRCRGDVVDLAVVSEQLRGRRVTGRIAIATARSVDRRAVALDHRPRRGDAQLATGRGLLGHGARHDGAVAVEGEDVVALPQVDGDAGAAQHAVLLIGRVLQFVGGDAEGLQVLLRIDIGPHAGHAGFAARTQVDARTLRVGRVRCVERDAPTRGTHDAVVLDGAARGLDGTAVLLVVLAVGNRVLVRRIRHHFGDAAGLEGHAAGLLDHGACGRIFRRGHAGSGLQEDRAVALHRGLCGDAALLVHRQGGQRDIAPVGHDVAGVADQAGQVQVGPVLRRFDLDHETAQRDVVGIVVDRQIDLAAGRQHHLAVGRLDDARLVVDGRREQHDRAAGVGGDAGRGSARQAGDSERDAARLRPVGPGFQRGPGVVVAAGKCRRDQTASGQHARQEALVGQVQRRRHQRLHVDLRAAVEQDAVLVDQDHLTARRRLAVDDRPGAAELALDDAGVGVVDAIEGRRRAARMAKQHLGVAADVERLPVDDRALRCLIDGQRRSGRATNRRVDHGLTRDHPAQHGQRAGAQCPGRGTLRRSIRRQRRPQQPQCGQDEHAAAALAAQGLMAGLEREAGAT